MAVLLGLDLAVILTLVSYAAGAMDCWRMNAMGLDILCPAQIPLWSWIATVGVAFALIAGLVTVSRRSSR
jgi:hypothetical protein